MTPQPLSEQAFFVLATLTDGPRHGYGVISEAAALSDGRVRLPVGTLYGILDRLAERAAIEVDREVIVDSRLRRYYRLTDAGHHLLAREAARLEANARMAARRLAGFTAPRPARGSAAIA